jgi:hypothetical protein
MTTHRIRVLLRQSGMKSFLLIVMAVTCGILSAPEIIISMAAAEDPKPVAIISTQLTGISVGKTVILFGDTSFDPKGGELDYQWKLVSTPKGSTAMLYDDNSSQAKFIPDAVGIYKVRLVVNSGLTYSDPAIYTIEVTK